VRTSSGGGDKIGGHIYLAECYRSLGTLDLYMYRKNKIRGYNNKKKHP
jgi:hypothetical protein